MVSQLHWRHLVPRCMRWIQTGKNNYRKHSNRSCVIHLTMLKFCSRCWSLILQNNRPNIRLGMATDKQARHGKISGQPRMHGSHCWLYSDPGSRNTLECNESLGPAVTKRCGLSRWRAVQRHFHAQAHALEIALLGTLVSLIDKRWKEGLKQQQQQQLRNRTVMKVWKKRLL
jgi:hypothetical protein